MSGIFGIVQHDGTAVSTADLDSMRRSMGDWGPDGIAVWQAATAGLGQARLFSTPESPQDGLPRLEPVSGIAFTAAARVDNRGELADQLKIPARDLAELADGELLFRAYLCWGSETPKHVFGDWAFAAWHPAERKLFLARDHYGNTALFYHAGAHCFAFSSSCQALLELNLAPTRLDELYLAQVLVSWTGYQGERTIHGSIRRLPPAHTLTVIHSAIRLEQYWRLEDTPELRMPRRSDYVEAFTAIFDTAVRARLRKPTIAGTPIPIASTLSGGLDSGSVTATAAGLLRPTRQRITAFTSVPLWDTSVYVGKRFGDELPFAQATARYAGNVDLETIAGASFSPIEAIQRMLEITNEPGHAAGNFFWILELERAARARGCRVLLTGQMGNAGGSWTGNGFSQPLAGQVRHFGLLGWMGELFGQAKKQTKRALPPKFLFAWQRLRAESKRWWRESAIHPEFACRLKLLEQWLSDPGEKPPATPREARCRILLPGRCFAGALHAQMGAANGLEIRDPTADARLLAFTISVPDHVFMDPETGLDRWLIREAMKGRLPDKVRLNRRRGRQAGDLVPRLRTCSAEVENALEEIDRGPGGAYVDVPYMREVWRMIQTQDSAEAFRKSVTVLTRGIMAGLFVNQFAGEIPHRVRQEVAVRATPLDQLEAVS